MSNNLFKWLRRIVPDSYNFFSFSRNRSSINDFENFLISVNKKIWDQTNSKKKSISLDFYEKYFDNLKSLGLWKDFETITSKDKILLKGSVLTSPIINQNNGKLIIFCHGITSNKWSLFYSIHLVIELGYQIVIYDARNHGLSGKSYNTLGKVESLDLEDIIRWTIKTLKPKKIGLYGFSMGSATLLFWIGQFQDKHPRIVFAICDSPFDEFKKRFLDFLDISRTSLQKNLFSDWKVRFFYNLAMKMLNSPIDISEINPILVLPRKLKIKLLLLHGLNDTVIPWESSMQIWKTLSKNPANKRMVDLYLFDKADHGELSLLGDYFPGSIQWVKGKKRELKCCFSSIICNFLAKNF